MKLYIDQKHANEAGHRLTNIDVRNERGELVPGLYAVSVHHDLDDAARIELRLAVNGRDVLFGKPPGMAAQKD